MESTEKSSIWRKGMVDRFEKVDEFKNKMKVQIYKKDGEFFIIPYIDNQIINFLKN